MDPIPGVRITLISPQSMTPYSGMLPGHLAGYYTYDECHIDLRHLSIAAGAEFWLDTVTHIDPQQQRIVCAHHPELRYDWVSVDIGSTPILPDIPGSQNYGVPVKPWQSFLTQWQTWIEACERHRERPVTLVIVGGGAGGVEMVLNVQRRLQQVLANQGESLTIHLVHRGDRILDQHNPWVRQRCHALLQQRGIHLHLKQSVAAVDATHLTLTSGAQIAYDQLFWVTGAQAPDWIAQTGLATTPGDLFRSMTPCDRPPIQLSLLVGTSPQCRMLLAPKLGCSPYGKASP